MIRVTDAEWENVTLICPEQITSISVNYDKNCTSIALSDGTTALVRETVSEVDLLIQQYRRANS